MLYIYIIASTTGIINQSDKAIIPIIQSHTSSSSYSTGTLPISVAHNNAIILSDTATNTITTSTNSDNNAIQEELIDLLLDPNGNMIQDIILETIVNSTDSFIRDTLYKFIKSDTNIPMKIIKNSIKTPYTIVNNIIPKPFKTLLLPLTLPLTLPYDTSKVLMKYIEVDEQDYNTVQSINELWNIITPKIIKEFENITKQTNNKNNNDIPINILNILQNINSQQIITILNDKKIQKRLLDIINISRKANILYLQKISKRIEVNNININNNNINNNNLKLLNIINQNEDTNAIQKLLSSVISSTTTNLVKRL